MQEMNCSNRLVFGNIFIRNRDSYILLNLYSFRRMVLSPCELETLLSCRDKFNNGVEWTASEKKLYETLAERKQIISGDLLSQFLAGKAKEHETNLNEINHKISRITISPTFSCNFNCVYCYQRGFQSKSDSLCVDAINNICKVVQAINKTEDYCDGIYEVAINGGEPLQEKNVETINSIIEHFAKPGIKLTLLTNGYNIFSLRDRIDFSKFTSVQVSLDNIDPYTSEINGVKYPISGEVLNGLSYLLTLNCTITVAALFSRELISNIDAFINCLESIGILDNERCKVTVTPAVAFGKGTLDTSFYSIKDFIEIRNHIKTKKLPRNLTIGTISEARWIARAIHRQVNDRICGKPSMCSILTNRSVHFAPNGQMYWCLCVDPNTGSLGTFFPSISINETEIDRCIHKSIYSNDKCRVCEYQFICSSGCPLHSIVATGTYSDPFCGFFFEPEFWNNLEELLM